LFTAVLSFGSHGKPSNSRSNQSSIFPVATKVAIHKSIPSAINMAPKIACIAIVTSAAVASRFNIPDG
jgi:hypothetical protein